MKILIATGIFVPEVGGHSTYVKNLAEGLAKTGGQVTVVCYSDRVSYDFDKNFSFAVKRIQRQPGKFNNYWQYGKKLWSEIRNHDLIYLTDTLSVGWLVWLITRIYRRPYFLRVSGDVVWEKLLEQTSQKITLEDFYKKRLYRQKYWLFYVVKIISRGAKRVIFNARQLKNIWIKNYDLPESRAITIYNPLPSVKSLSFGHRPEIFYAGRLSAVKNVDFLLKAFSLSKLSHFRLVIVGEGPQLKRLQDLAKQLGIDSQVEWLAPLEQSELWQRLEQGRGLVLPSLTDISPNIIGEAVVRKFPFFVTEYNFLPFAIPSQLLIDPFEADELAQKLKWFDDYEKRKELIELVGKIDWRWSWPGVIQKHWQILSGM